MNKTKLGFTFFYHKGNGNSQPEYAHPEFDFYRIEDYKRPKEWIRSHHQIMSIMTQTDRKRGHTIWKAYGLRGESVSISDDSIKILNAIVKTTEKNFYNPNRAILKAIKVLKAERLYYHSNSHQMIPWKYRKNAELWVNAFKNGLKLEKI